MKNELLDRIQSRGHWRVNFQPLYSGETRIALTKCWTMIETNKVELRGWDYPHYPVRNDENGGRETHDEFVEGWCDWMNHIEFWRLYQSQQFLHYLSLREDWIELDAWKRQSNPDRPSNPLNVTGTIYTLTEIFELCRRLHVDGLYKNGVRVSVKLRRAASKSLYVDDPRRMPFLSPRTTAADEITCERELTAEDIESESLSIAAEFVAHVFERFDWTIAPAQISPQQETFLKGLI